MSENLDFRMQPKRGLPHIQKCYDDDPVNCDTCTICAYVYHHRYINFSTYFMTSGYRQNRVPPRIYTLNIQTNYSELYPIETNFLGYYSLRCVKDE